MDIELLRQYCLKKKGVTEGFPFGENTLVFKVGGKMFALANLDGELSVNLKCDPERAVELREEFACVIPGFHMNKTHWNTILVDGSVPDQIIFEWVNHSYTIVRDKLPSKTRQALQ